MGVGFLRPFRGPRLFTRVQASQRTWLGFGGSFVAPFVVLFDNVSPSHSTPPFVKPYTPPPGGGCPDVQTAPLLRWLPPFWRTTLDWLLFFQSPLLEPFVRLVNFPCSLADSLLFLLFHSRFISPPLPASTMLADPSPFFALPFFNLESLCALKGWPACVFVSH